MVAHQVGKAMEEAACGSKRTNAASRVVKPTVRTINTIRSHCERKIEEICRSGILQTVMRMAFYANDFSAEVSSRSNMEMSARVL